MSGADSSCVSSATGPSSDVAVSVIIPSRGTPELLRSCLASIERQRALRDACEVEVVVVDDDGRDGLDAWLTQRFPFATLLVNDRQRGFSASVNRGAAQAGGDVLVVLNSDTELPTSERCAFATLLERLEGEPAWGCAGAELVYPDGSPQWSGGRQPTALWCFLQASTLGRLLGRRARLKRLGGRGDHRREVDWVSGAALVVRRELIEDDGLFDLRYALYAQDLDLCCRARQSGLSVFVLEGWKVRHHQGATVRKESSSLGSTRTDLLWSDLLLWQEKFGIRGPLRAALRAGGRLRLSLLALGFGGAARSQEAQALRRALDVTST